MYRDSSGKVSRNPYAFLVSTKKYSPGTDKREYFNDFQLALFEQNIEYAKQELRQLRNNFLHLVKVFREYSRYWLWIKLKYRIPVSLCKYDNTAIEVRHSQKRVTELLNEFIVYLVDGRNYRINGITLYLTIIGGTNNTFQLSYNHHIGRSLFQGGLRWF